LCYTLVWGRLKMVSSVKLWWPPRSALEDGSTTFIVGVAFLPTSILIGPRRHSDTQQQQARMDKSIHSHDLEPLPCCLVRAQLSTPWGWLRTTKNRALYALHLLCCLQGHRRCSMHPQKPILL
jgi:hypothetical protein